MSENQASRVIFSGQTVCIGEFRCAPGHPLWREENIARGALMVFPRVPVGIDQAGREPVLADPNTVMFYNAGQPYRRRLVSQRGDECEFFVVDPALVAEVVRRHDPVAAEAPGTLFRYPCGPADSPTYLRQRRLCDRVRAGRHADPLEVEESALALLDGAVAASSLLRGMPGHSRDDTNRAHADLAENAKLVLAQRLAEPLSLAGIARSVHSSPFHLCRVFRRHTGISLHRYRDRLRLRAALERLSDGRRALIRLALDLGYSSHSHFTDAFRREFGMTPSVFRDSAPSRMSRFLGEDGAGTRLAS